MESAVGAIGFFFAALAAGLNHFPDIESSAAALPTEYANVSSVTTPRIQENLREVLINFLRINMTFSTASTRLRREQKGYVFVMFEERRMKRGAVRELSLKEQL
jgi:hypothetical protein